MKTTETNNLLKNGGWTFQGSREDIILDERDETGRRYQVTRCSDQTGPHDGHPQFRQRFAGHMLRCDLGMVRLDTTSRASWRSIREAAEAGRDALAAGVPIVVIRRRRAGYNDEGTAKS
jgi:hypothetical protein